MSSVVGWRVRSVCAAALFSLAGCSSAATFTQTGVAGPSRPKNCEFQALTTSPGQPYREIGVIDVKPGKDIAKLGKFEDLIRPYVCESGGDAAIVLANGEGSYIKATVVALR